MHNYTDNEKLADDLDNMQEIVDNIEKAQEELRILRELKRANENAEEVRFKLNRENGSTRVN